MTFPDLVVEFAPGNGPFDNINYLACSASGGSHAFMPDSVASSITGAFVIEAHIRADDYASGADQTVVAKWTSSGNQRGFDFGIAADGALFIRSTSDGTAATAVRFDSNDLDASAVISTTDGEDMWIRGGVFETGGVHAALFHVGTDGVAWRRLGSVANETTGSYIIDNGTAVTRIGDTGDATTPFAGRVYELRLYSGGMNDFDDDAALYANPDFRGVPVGTTSYDDGFATWTLSSDAITSVISWVDISDYVLTAQWQDGRDDEHAAFAPGAATVVLKNDDRRFDPDNSSGPYFGELDPRTPFRILSTTDAATFQGHFYGFVEGGFEQSYGNPEVSECTVRLTDMLGVLSGYVLPSVLEREILRDQPKAYWPLDDADEIARDASGNGHHGTYRDEPTLTTEDDGIVFGMGARLFDGVSQAVDLPESCRISVSGGGGFTIAAFFATDSSPVSGEYDTIYNQSGDAHQVDVARMTIDDDDKLSWAFLTDGSGNVVYTDTESLVVDGSMHYGAFRLFYGDVNRFGGTFLDGVNVPFATTSQGSGNGSAVVIGGHPNPNNPRDYFAGRINAVAIFQDHLLDARLEAHYQAGRSPLNLLRSDEQITWVLDYVGVPDTLRDLDEGRAFLGPADTKGKDALEFIRQVAAAEGGGFYVDHTTGKLRFTERYTYFLAPRSTTSQATFSDDPAAAASAVRVEPEDLVIRPNGIDSVINQVTVSWRGGSETAQDEASIKRFGPRGREVDAQAGTAAQAYGLAQWLLALSLEPQTRVAGLGLNPGATQAFDVVRDLRINDLVSYRSQPQATGSVTTRALIVQGADHSVERGVSWRTRYRVSSAPADQGVNLFILDTSELDGSDILAF